MWEPPAQKGGGEGVTLEEQGDPGSASLGSEMEEGDTGREVGTAQRAAPLL